MTSATFQEKVDHAEFDAILVDHHKTVDGTRLFGRIYGDSLKRFIDGTLVTTSTIIEMDKGYAQTRNTFYKLT